MDIQTTQRLKVNYKKLILVLGIIIVLNLFFNFGVRTFYHEPQYNDLCPEGYLRYAPVSYPADPKDKAVMFEYEKSQIEIGKKQKECSDKYNAVRDVYNRNVFIVLITLGVLSIIIGFLVGSAEAVSLGLSFGGLISLIVGTIRYWSAMNDYLRFVILGIALVALIWTGLKKFRE